MFLMSDDLTTCFVNRLVEFNKRQTFKTEKNMKNFAPYKIRPADLNLIKAA